VEHVGRAPPRRGQSQAPAAPHHQQQAALVAQRQELLAAPRYRSTPATPRSVSAVASSSSTIKPISLA
jgi:hypothetical protein